jgi:hypothetical protein
VHATSPILKVILDFDFPFSQEHNVSWRGMPSFYLCYTFMALAAEIYGKRVSAVDEMFCVAMLAFITPTFQIPERKCRIVI